MTPTGYLLLAIGAAGFGAAMLFLGFFLSKRIGEGKILAAERMAERIVAEAQREAETLKRSAHLEAKEEAYRAKAAFEKEVQAKRQEIGQQERRLVERDGSIDRKADLLRKKEGDFDLREKDLGGKERALLAKDERLTKLLEEENAKLEHIAGMTQEQARQFLLQNLEAQARHDAAQIVKEIKDKARETADREAKEIVTQAIQRCATDHTVESTVSVVSLPSDEVKGRIIGREGRNIRAFEAATGVEVLIDDTPEAAIISGFDPVRREVARLALERLVSDGRIQPSRIEEVVVKARAEVEQSVRAAGEAICLEMGIAGLHPEIVKLLGRMKYRSSYGQNILQHSREVALLAGMMAGELGMDTVIAKRAGLLHDLGKAADQTMEGTHTEIGVELARKYGEPPVVLDAIASHHDDVEAQSAIAVLVDAADGISGARPGARRETLEAYIKRLEKLEELANSIKGVEKCYAIQAGREIRIIVEPEKVTDMQSQEMASEIARKIESQLEYPGQIKVTVIRETRAVEYAK